MRRENLEASKPRIYLGDIAIAFTDAVRPADEPISGKHLDIAIAAHQAKVAGMEAALKKSEELCAELLHRFDKTEELRVLSDRGHLMLHGQIHRELKGLMGLVGLLVARKSPDDLREGDLEAAIRVVEDLVAETRNTLAYWRAREGLEMPEYDRHKMQEEHDRLLAEARLINARALAQQQQKEPRQQEMER